VQQAVQRKVQQGAAIMFEEAELIAELSYKKRELSHAVQTSTTHSSPDSK
jgi:hypothetical protein